MALKQNYKNNKMYILPTDNNKNKFPSKIVIDGVAATISSDWTDDVGRQVGTGKYLQDNNWHHWLIELSEVEIFTLFNEKFLRFGNPFNPFIFKTLPLIL